MWPKNLFEVLPSIKGSSPPKVFKNITFLLIYWSLARQDVKKHH